MEFVHTRTPVGMMAEKGMAHEEPRVLVRRAAGEGGKDDVSEALLKEREALAAGEENALRGSIALLARLMDQVCCKITNMKKTALPPSDRATRISRTQRQNSRRSCM